MNKIKVLILILVVLLIGVGVYFWTKENNTPSKLEALAKAGVPDK